MVWEMDVRFWQFVLLARLETFVGHELKWRRVPVARTLRPMAHQEITIDYLANHSELAEELARWSWNEWQEIYKERGQTFDLRLVRVDRKNFVTPLQKGAHSFVPELPPVPRGPKDGDRFHSVIVGLQKKDASPLVACIWLCNSSSSA